MYYSYGVRVSDGIVHRVKLVHPYKNMLFGEVWDSSSDHTTLRTNMVHHLYLKISCVPLSTPSTTGSHVPQYVQQATQGTTVPIERWVELPGGTAQFEELLAL